MSNFAGPSQSVGSLLAAQDLTASYYKFVSLDATGKVIPATAGIAAIGVLTNKPLTGQACSIVVWGFCQIISNANLASAGTIISSDSGGSPRAALSGDYPLGLLMIPMVAGSGEVASIFVNPGLRVV